MVFKCQCCGTDVPVGHPSHRGIMLNAIASLGSKIVQAREHIQQLRSKRWSKQFKEQRERDMRLLAELEARLPVMEGTWYGMRFLEKELYDGRRSQVGR